MKTALNVARLAVTPLADQSYPQWFMHGFQNDQPREVMDLPAGGQVTIETTCRKDFTTYGSQTTDANDPMSACPIECVGLAGLSSCRTSSLTSVLAAQTLTTRVRLER